MQRRNFIKILGALPLFTIFKGQNTFGLTNTSQKLVLPNYGSIFQILENVNPGQHIAIGARPSMGKSTVALNLANEIVLNKNFGCVYFSLEMSKETLMQRLIGISSGISTMSIQSEQISIPQYSRLIQTTQKLTETDLYINDDSKITVEEMTIQIKKLKLKGKKIKYVFVDYVHLLRAKKSYSSRRHQITGILKQLKELAVQENIVVVSLAQLNRGVELRVNRRPIPADFRETNDLTSIDQLILLYQKDYYADQNEKINLPQNSEIEFITYKGYIKVAYDYVGYLDKSNLRIINVISSSKTRLS